MFNILLQFNTSVRFSAICVYLNTTCVRPSNTYVRPNNTSVRPSNTCVRLSTFCVRLNTFCVRLSTFCVHFDNRLPCKCVRIKKVYEGEGKIHDLLLFLPYDIRFYYLHNYPTMMLLCIDKLLKSKGILKPYTWLRTQGITHNVAYKMLRKPYIRLSTKHINTICEAAWCTPSDLFEWLPDTPTADIPTHPLQALKPKVISNLLPDLQKLSPQQLAEIQAEIKKRI